MAIAFPAAAGSLSTSSDVLFQHPSGIRLLLSCGSCQDFKTKSCLSNSPCISSPTCRAKAVYWSLIGSASSAFPFYFSSYCFCSKYKIKSCCCCFFKSIPFIRSSPFKVWTIVFCLPTNTEYCLPANYAPSGSWANLSQSGTRTCLYISVSSLGFEMNLLEL